MNYQLFSLKKLYEILPQQKQKINNPLRKYSSVNDGIDDLFFKTNELSKPKKLLSEDYFQKPNPTDAETCYFKQTVTGGIQGIYQVICFLCSNNDIVIRFVLFKKFDQEEMTSVPEDDDLHLNAPLSQVIHYFKTKPLASIALEENGKTLVCVSEDREVYLVPICRMFFPSQSLNQWPFQISTKTAPHSVNATKSKDFPSLMNYLSNPLEKKNINFIEELKDISLCSTKKIASKTQGTIMTCCVFWKTYDAQNFVIVGTEKGHVLFFNLSNQNVDHSIGGLEEIKKFEIVSDISSTYRYLVIHSVKGVYNRLMLEQYDNEFLHFKNICTNHSTDGKFFTPTKIELFQREFPCKVSVTNDKRKGPLICIKKKQTISIYDADSLKLLLYNYALKDPIFKYWNTDSLLFTTSNDKISIVSKLLAVNEIKNESIFQEFAIRDDIKGFIRDYHQNDLEGAYLWSKTCLYELVQQNSPKEMFNYLLAKNVIPNYKLEEFGKTFALNMLKLYERGADQMYDNDEFELAFHYYRLSNISETKYVKKLMKLNQMNQINEYLTNILKNPTSLTMFKKREITSLLYSIYMYEFSNGEIKADMIHSLVMNNEFQGILEQLYQKGLVSTLIQYSSKNKMIQDVNDLLVSKGVYNLQDSDLDVFWTQKFQPDILLVNEKMQIVLFQESKELTKLSQEDIVTILTKMDFLKNSTLVCLLLIHLNRKKKTQIHSHINNLLYTFSQEKLIENLVNSNEIIMSCFASRNYPALAKLYDLNDLFIESLFAKLKNEHTDVKILKIFEEYLGKPNLEKTTSLVFYFWNSLELNVEKLEESCLKHVNTLCAPIVELIQHHCPLEFSSKFYLKLNLHYVKVLKKSFIHDVELQKQIFGNMKDTKNQLILPIRSLKKMVAFSCGHKFEWSEFEKLIGDFRAKMKEFAKDGKSDEVQINNLLTTCLSEDYWLYKSDQMMSNACPNCIIQSRVETGQFL
jgi:hypothetical protein